MISLKEAPLPREASGHQYEAITRKKSFERYGTNAARAIMGGGPWWAVVKL